MAHDNHGKTPAAWTAVTIALIGFLVGGVALVLEPISWVLFWIGAAILPLSLIVGKVLSTMGMGADRETQS